ncbi:MAG TPA: ABC transporter ATP-binding protein [Thermoleophilaceae bacterium]|jgi:ABC-2 type transport system ATP-binding protein|nr:ABC transporter ATP-binding protein [Thermoleophilaceae bacterium]
MSMEERPGADPQGPPIAARGLVKRYRNLAAVDRIDLTVRPGDIYGFLGPNGAGKTTTLRMLMSLVRPDAGSIRLFGRELARDPIAALQGVAGFIEEPRLYPYLSGRANLELLAAFDRNRDPTATIDEVLDLVELRDRAGDRVSEYSQGMRQRLGIASCLVRRPKLLLLDEPANGVDPAGLRFLRELLRRLADDGITILLSSHLLSEVEQVCTRVAMISRGRIVYEGAIGELREVARRPYRLEPTDLEAAVTAMGAEPAVSDVRVEDGALLFTAADDSALVAVTSALASAGVGVRALTRASDSLEHLFFELTERAPAEVAT